MDHFEIINNDLPFSRKIIICDNFRQLPIKIHGTCEIMNLSIKFFPNWRHFISFSLTEDMRVLPEETEFAKFLLDMGDGILNDSNDNIQFSDYCIAFINVDIVEDTYDDLI